MTFVLKFHTTKDGQVYPYYEDDQDPSKGDPSGDYFMPGNNPDSGEPWLLARPNNPDMPSGDSLPTQNKVPDILEGSGIDAAIPESEYRPRTYEQAVAERADQRRAALEDRRADLDHQDMNDYVSRAIEPERQFVRGMAGTALGAPWDMAGILSKVAPLMLNRDAQMEAVAGNAENPLSDFLFSQGASARRGVTNLLGADPDPQHPINRAANTFGSAVVPYGKNIAASAAIVGGVNIGADIASRALETPSLRAFSKGAPQWLNQAFFTPAKGETKFTVDPKNPSKIIGTGPFDQAPVSVNTVTGPGTITKGEYQAIGGIAALTMGMIFTPMIYRRFADSAIPRFITNITPASMRSGPRNVVNAAPGTQAISNVVDLARTYDDVNAGALRVMRRAGVVPASAARVEEVMRIQTRATANALIDAAINTGRMNTPAYRFQVRMSLRELQARETQATRDYLHALDTWDEIRRHSNAPIRTRRANPTGGVVRGHDIVSVTNLRSALERTNPEVVQYAQAYRDNLRSMRRFEADGEYATLSRQQVRQLNAEYPNEVPFRGTARTSDPNFDRGSPINALADRMRDMMRRRMENEAKGMYVDAVRNSSTNPNAANIFNPVTNDALVRNPNWRPNTVTFERRGIAEHYTADPFVSDVLRMDPYYITGGVGQLFYATKRLMETTTTGELAPHFSVTSFLRNWQLGKMSPDPGMRGPTFIGSVAAIPQQLYPQLAQSIHNSLERTGAAAWLQQNAGFGGNFVQDLSNRLGYHYQRSFWSQMETVGGGRGAIMQQQINANNRLGQAIQEAAGPARTFLEGYRATLNAIHNAPSYNYGMRNRRLGLPDHELARRMRGLTGDPRIGGEFYTNLPGKDKPTPIRFQNAQGVTHTGARAVQAYGGMTEIGRTAIPWYNATTQGVKRIGQAYLDDPVRFTGRMWLYQIAPSAGLYMATRAAGNDPNGLSYLDYMMNMRSEYNKMMNFYIPIPGKPANQGIEFPSFHEGSTARYLSTIALDHAYGNNVFPLKDDLIRAAHGITGVIFEPSMPPLGNLLAAQFGIMPMQGIFAGEGYRKKQEPYDQRGGLSANTEGYMRALAPALADIVGNGAAAFIQTPKNSYKTIDKLGDYVDAVGAGVKGAGTRFVQKTPILRDALNLQQPATGNNAITEELFKKSKAIRSLETFYKKWTVGQGLIGAKAPSIGGEKLAAGQLGPRQPAQAAGINQPEPTNPLYNMFIEDMHRKFVTDSPLDRKGKPQGAVGFRSLWNRYSIATQQIDRLRKVNPGNDALWREELDDRPQQLKYLRDNKIDPYNPRAVQNFYERKRQDAARVLLKTIRDVENDFSKRLGRPVKIENLDPYGQGLDDHGEFDPADNTGVLE